MMDIQGDSLLPRNPRGVVGAMTAEKAQLYQSEGSLGTGDFKKGEGRL
jgi:hypothetical protein